MKISSISDLSAHESQCLGYVNVSNQGDVSLAKSSHWEYYIDNVWACSTHLGWRRYMSGNAKTSILVVIIYTLHL